MYIFSEKVTIIYGIFKWNNAKLGGKTVLEVF